MGAQGTATLDFGAFPGKSDASVTVTGQAGILSNSLVEAWIYPVATADHTEDEHMLETVKVVAGNVVAGTGFTVYGFNINQVHEPLRPPGVGRIQQANPTAGNNYNMGGGEGSVGGSGTMIYGQWTVAWVWN